MYSTLTAENPATHAYQGLYQNEGQTYRNWGLSRETRPAVYAEPLSYADVQTMAVDRARFPSPLRPVGAMLSVTDTIVNNGGTMLCTRKLDEILGLETAADGKRQVRVQAGCRLKKLNMWLKARGLEIPFQAEIGEATVGSVAVGDTKESSLNGPGYFSAHVIGVRYVNADGRLCSLSVDDGAAFYEFKCSYGLLGIVVECLIEIRPLSLCRSDISFAAYATPAALADGLLVAQRDCDALLAIVFLHQLAAFLDQRHLAGDAPPGHATACEEFRLAKRLAIQHGFDGVDVPQPKGIVYPRHDFVNEYWQPHITERRLDFQYYEHDLPRFSEVIIASYNFTRDFEARTGFAPKGWATYFVKRPAREQKPYGLYSAGPGISFSFDPFCSDPLNPLWQQFARQYNQLAIHVLGGNASPIQTQWLERGDFGIPRHLAHERFTTPYYAQFLTE